MGWGVSQMSREWLLRPVAATPEQLLPARKPEGTRPVLNGAGSFRAELDKRLQSQRQLAFSAHALDRLRIRNIRLTQDDIARIESAVNKVAAKGGRDSLVIYKEIAYVVSISNRTVITAVDMARMNDHVFTQIDSAVFA